MGIVAQPDLYFTKYDLKKRRQIGPRRSLLADQRSCCLHLTNRWFYISNLTTATITKMDGRFNVPRTIKTFSVTGNPEGMWGRGRYLWKLSAAGTVHKIDMKTGRIVDTLTISGSFRGLTGNYRYCWTINNTSGNVEKYDRKKSWALVDGSFTAPSNSRDLHYDSRWLWILTGADSVQGTIKKYDQKIGTQIRSFNTILYGLSETAYSITGGKRFAYVLDSQ
jgi:hypothetical protein